MKSVFALLSGIILLSSATPLLANFDDVEREVTAVKYLRYQQGDTGHSDSFLDHVKFFTTLSSELRNIEKDLILDADSDGNGAIDSEEEYLRFVENNAEILAEADLDLNGTIDTAEYYKAINSVGSKGGVGEGVCEYLGVLANAVPLSGPLLTISHHCGGWVD